MNFIVWIIFGGLAGWLGSMIAGSDLSLLGNIIVGIVGSAVGGWLAGVFNVDTRKKFSFISFAFAVVGSALLLVIVNLIF